MFIRFFVRGINRMVSVIVPVYNAEEYITECAKSIIYQSYPDIELILVDDGSSDNSGAICDEISKENKHVRVIHKRNGGLISAWTAGVELASGEYIGFVDSDDYLERDYYSTLMHPVELYNCEVSMCGFCMEGEISKFVKPIERLETGLYVSEVLEEIKRNYFEYGIQNSRCLKVIKRELLVKNLKYVDSKVVLGEDMTISVPCVLDSHAIYMNQEYFGYHYRIYNTSMSHSLKKGQVDNFFRLFETIRFVFQEKGYENKTVTEEFVRQMISVIGLIIFSKDNNTRKIEYLKQFRNHEEVEQLCRVKMKLSISWRFLRKLFAARLFRLLLLIGLIKGH